MANFFDKFDEPGANDAPANPLRVTVGGPIGAGNFFDQFDEQPPQRSGMGMNAAAGLNEGIYGTLGAPVDIAAGAINMGVRGINAMTGSEIPTIDEPFGGSRSIARGFGTIGVPDPATVQASDGGEKLMRAAGQGAGYMLAPELAVRGGAQMLGKTLSPLVEGLIGTSRSAPELAGNAVIGATAGGAGSMAGQLAPEPLKPIAEMAGNLIGGGVGALAANAPRMAREGGRMGAEYLAPLTAPGQERIAATTLRDAATDPLAVRQSLESGANELVPGSRPTTFQQSGDMGLGGLERSVATRAPEEFMQRRAEQNIARSDALGGIQAQGHPEAVVNALRQNLADLDESTNLALTAATTRARHATAQLRGDGTPESYGASMRQTLADAETAAREREGVLWKAVDPDEKLALDVSAIQKEARSIVEKMPASAKPFEGEERGILQTAAGFQGVMPFSEVVALRTRVSTDMRRELSRYGSTPVYARLSQLRGAIEQQIEAAVAGKAAQEAEAVASGALRQEDTMLSQWEAAFASSAENWLGERARNVGANSVAGAGANGPARPPSISPAYGSQGQGRGRPYDTPGNSGVPGDAGLIPNFDEAALERLREATDATKQRAQTFGRGPVGDTLRRSGQEGPFNVPSSVVPQKFFRPGPRGYQDVAALRGAVNTPEAMSTVRDYAISTLRRTAEEPNGVLDANRVRAWRDKHADALRAFPEIDQMLANPIQASETMVRLAAERKQAMDTYQAGLVGRLIGVQDPADVVRMVGGVFSAQNSATVMRRLVAETSANPEALNGLRKAVADHITQRLTSNTEAATSGQSLLRSDAFQQFIRQNEAALKEVLKPEEIGVLKAIAADLQRSNRSLNAVRIPGQSNTAQDRTSLAKANQQPSLLLRLVTLGGQFTAGMAATGGPWGGIAAAIGGEAVAAMRKAGLQKVDNIITDAMLNPERARLLLQTAGDPREAANIGRRLMESYRRSTTLPAINLMDADMGERPPISPGLPNNARRSQAQEQTRQRIAGTIMGVPPAPAPMPTLSTSAPSPMAEQIRQVILGNGSRGVGQAR